MHKLPLKQLTIKMISATIIHTMIVIIQKTLEKAITKAPIGERRIVIIINTPIIIQIILAIVQYNIQNNQETVPPKNEQSFKLYKCGSLNKSQIISKKDGLPSSLFIESLQSIK
eukprot:TRINITY_DN705_c1_g1_i2.p2 TRINITY_DN705_c1_g1~~TRINITY_DN705_c1_g1_i2.p2  ORF type:complete len:114 (+),score=6.39 TRINITY_DN705_c1_g1_i2:655-996(+)